MITATSTPPAVTDPNHTLSIRGVTDYPVIAELAQRWSAIAQKKLSESMAPIVSPLERELLTIYMGALEFARQCRMQSSGLSVCADPAGHIHGLLYRNDREVVLVPNPIDIASEPGRIAGIGKKLKELAPISKL